jgi:predicted dehydrogenase
VLEDKSVDAVVIATPDHWHAPAAILACAAGKHVYVEKPISHNPNEGELVIQASKKYNRIVQMGNQRRSWPNIIQCVNELHSGIIGNVYFAKGWYTNSRKTIGIGKVAPVPANLDYELWQGTAPRKEYKDNLIHYNWHWFWNWGTGEALNNGTHEIDLIRWGLGADYPTRLSSLGGRYHFKDDWETPDTQVINADFENGKSFTWESRSCNNYSVEGAGRGVIFYGDNGTLVTKGGNAYTVYDPSNKVVKDITEQNNSDKTNTVSPGGEFLDGIHLNNFFDTIRGNTVQNSPAEQGFKSVLICQLGNISYRTKRLLNIDSKNGHILNDEEAMKLWKRDYEKGWEPII